MSTKPPRRVLFVGGIADGQWHEVAADNNRYRVPLPLEPINLGAGPGPHTPFEPSFQTHDYQIEKFAMFGRVLHVALFVALDNRGRENAAMRTLFQRDVADQLIRGQ